MKNNLSLFAALLVFIFIFIATFIYYPKYGEGNEQVITWDVAGYYQYLPAHFIYSDLKKVGYLESLNEKYRFTPGSELVLNLPNGNRAMKYTIGQAVMYSPFFLIAHQYAKQSSYPADGFSLPYQFAIEIEILFFALIGLLFFRSILLNFFTDKISALTIVSVCLATNYFEYASITGAMTHNNLFALYAVLIFCTIRFNNRPRFHWAFAIGALVGLATLTRPTEIISVLIPLLWGLSLPMKAGTRNRLAFIRKHIKYFAVIGVVAAMVSSLQMIYWKHISGEWLIYSYGEEGFNWLSPHVEDCLISVRAGWLVYSPIMILSLVGFYQLYKYHKKLFPVIVIFSVLASYIVFSWQTWWYGGSLGQRALIQYYPLFAFPFAALITTIINTRQVKYIFYFLLTICVYYSMWLTHQVHRGGLVYVGQMTRPYFWKVLGRYEKNPDDLKLLDTDEYHRSDREDVQVIYENDFESVDVPRCHIPAIQGSNSPCLSSLDPQSPEYGAQLETGQAKWVRGMVHFKTEYPVYGKWNMGTMAIAFYNGIHEVKKRQIRYHRLLAGGETKQIFLDVKCPSTLFDKVTFQIHNGAVENLVVYDLVKIEVFN